MSSLKKERKPIGNSWGPINTLETASQIQIAVLKVDENGPSGRPWVCEWHEQPQVPSQTSKNRALQSLSQHSSFWEINFFFLFLSSAEIKLCLQEKNSAGILRAAGTLCFVGFQFYYYFFMLQWFLTKILKFWFLRKLVFFLVSPLWNLKGFEFFLLLLLLNSSVELAVMLLRFLYGCF